MIDWNRRFSVAEASPQYSVKYDTAKRRKFRTLVEAKDFFNAQKKLNPLVITLDKLKFYDNGIGWSHLVKFVYSKRKGRMVRSFKPHMNFW